MEGTKPRTVSSLGMFDLLKGIGMLAIVLPTRQSFTPSAPTTSPLSRSRCSLTAKR